MLSDRQTEMIKEIILDHKLSMITITIIIDIIKKMNKNDLETMLKIYTKQETEQTKTATIFFEWILMLKEIEEINDEN